MEEKEKHDEWYSQPDWYLGLCERYNVFPTLDVAASVNSHMCDEYFTKGDDALTKEWNEDFWMNPPLLKGNTKRFTLYAYEQHKKHDVNGLCVVPSGVISRKWFREMWVDFRCGLFDLDPIQRPTFLDRGILGQQSRNDYIVLVFRKRR